ARTPSTSNEVASSGSKMSCLIESIPRDGAGSLARRSRVEIGCAETDRIRSEEHTSELQSRFDLVCRRLLEKKKEKTSTRRDSSGMQTKDESPYEDSVIGFGSSSFNLS